MDSRHHAESTTSSGMQCQARSRSRGQANKSYCSGIRDFEKSMCDLTHLKKAPIKHIKWRKGRPYNIGEDTLLLTITNLPEISYLDLNEYSIDCNMYFEEEAWVSERIIDQRLEELHILDSQNLLWTHRFKDAFERLTDVYRSHVRSSLFIGVAAISSFWLLHKWDASGLRKSLPACQSLGDFMLRFSINFHSRMLLEYCSDSELISDYFKTVCTFSSVENALKMLHYSLLVFYTMHIVNWFQSHPQPGEFKQWLMDDLELVEKAFQVGDTQQLRMLLAYGWPSVFILHNVEGYELCSNWPRDASDPENAETYYSSRFLTFFVSAIINYTEDSEAPQEAKAACIELVWRAVPTPYVSTEDMKVFIQKNMSLQSIEPESFTKVWAMFEESVMVAYPKRCLADYQPRSMMHLSRCKVRDCMKEITSKNITTLPLPKKLKSYLLLEW